MESERNAGFRAKAADRSQIAPAPARAVGQGDSAIPGHPPVFADLSVVGALSHKRPRSQPHQHRNMHRLLLLYTLYGLSSAQAASRTPKSGGFPKFITSSCGLRAVHWYPSRDPRVIGGEVPPNGAVPWQARVRVKRQHRCGAVLVAEQLVVTAAHCVREDEDVFVLVGAKHQEQLVRVRTVVRHPGFRQEGPYSNDIAVLALERAVNWGKFVQRACLPAPGTEAAPDGSWCEVSGWGAQDVQKPESVSQQLRAAAVPLISLETCRKQEVYGGRVQEILESMVCAGQLRGGVDACGGDSGGPLVCERADGRFELTGLVSWGDGCAKSNRPGVYTRVASYASWIRDQARVLGLDYY